MAVIHPALDNRGRQVVLTNPSEQSAQEAWLAPDAHAVAIPMSSVPAQLAGVAFEPLMGPPDEKLWEQLTGSIFEEPIFELAAGKAAAAGIAILEPDGRVWVVAPSNQFGGYANSLPKGRVDPGMSLRSTAVREAFEETGLLAEIKGFLVDSTRTLTHTRFYIGRRVGGCPSRMGWESQAVHLIPMSKIATVLTHPNDKPVLDALLALAR